MKHLALLVCTAVLAAGSDYSGGEGGDGTSEVVNEVGRQFAIFKAESAASKKTTFTIQHTKITIVKHSEAESSALAATSRRPRIIVKDAKEKKLVCLPKGRVQVSGGKIIGGSGGGSVTSGSSTAATSGSGSTTAVDHGEAVAVDHGVTGVEGDKSSQELLIGQGDGVVASVSSASSAAAAGGAASSAASGGGSAASSAAGVGGAASSAAGGGSAASSAAGGGSAASSAAGEGSAASSAAGEGSAASSAAGEGSAASSTAGEGSAASSHSGEGSSSRSTSSEGEVSVHVTGDGEAAALGADGHGIHLSGDGSYRLIDERFCECVPDYLCDEEGYINTAGAGLIDIRSFSKKETARAYASKCGTGETCCKHRDKEAIGWMPYSCGARSPIRLDKRIVGGEASGIGRHPWMVAIIRSRANDLDEFLCGGSLIKEDVVLTGAHCVKKYQGDRLIVRVGEWDSCNTDDVYPHHDIVVSQVVVHEQFNSATLAHDVALLKLSTPAELAPHINTLCLPDAEHSAHIHYDECYATGWGKQSFDQSEYTNILKEVSLSVVGHDQCQSALRTTRLGRWFKLHDTFTCAGGQKGVDTCKGDGGSPLICKIPGEYPDEEKFVQVGLVAWGIGCGQEGIPGVYADVAHMLPWIEEHLNELHDPELVSY